MTITLHGAAYRTANWILERASLEGSGTLVINSETAPEGTSISGVVHGAPIQEETDQLVLVSSDHPTAILELQGDGVSFERTESLAGDDIATITLDGAKYSTVPRPSYVEVVSVVLEQSTREMAEAAHQAYGLTRDHVTTRQQFGGPLIKLPAVASNVARMRVLLAQMDAALMILNSRQGPSSSNVDTVPLAVRSARSTAAIAGSELIRLAHQLHGAQGIREDHPLHRCSRVVWQSRDFLVPDTKNLIELGNEVMTEGEEAVWEKLTPFQ